MCEGVRSVDGRGRRWFGRGLPVIAGGRIRSPDAVHPLTKVLVVLAALLSIALSALTIAFTANADRVRREFESERQLRLSAQDSVDRERNAHQTEKARLETELTSLQGTNSGLVGTVADLQRDNARLLADLKSMEASGLSTQAKIDQLTAMNQTLTNLIAKYREEVTNLRENELRFARREIELGDRLADVTGQLEVAVENNRALQEQLVELKDQLATARSGGGGSMSGETVVKATTPVRARITGVRKDASGDVLVQIDAGTNSQLRANMELSIVRGDKFLAKVVVQAVDFAESVGRVDFLGRQGLEIRPGDTVISLVQ